MYNVLFKFYSRVKYLNLFQQISILNSYILIQISLYPIESFDVPVHVFWKIQLEFPILQKNGSYCMTTIVSFCNNSI